MLERGRRPTSVAQGSRSCRTKPSNNLRLRGGGVRIHYLSQQQAAEQVEVELSWDSKGHLVQQRERPEA